MLSSTLSTVGLVLTLLYSSCASVPVDVVFYHQVRAHTAVPTDVIVAMAASR